MHRQPGYIDGRRTRVGNVPIWGPVPNVLIPGSMEAYGIFEEFTGIEDLAAAATLALPSGAWDFFIVVACAVAQSDLAGGAVVLTTGATDEDAGQITMGSAASGGAFFPLANALLWFEARMRVGMAVAADTFNYWVGLVDPTAAAILPAGGGAITFNNILGFIAQDGDSDWSTVGRETAVQDLNPLGGDCVVDDEWHTYGFYIDGVTEAFFYYDHVLQTLGTVVGASIPLTGLMPSIGIRTGDTLGVADTIEVDYIMCVQLRV